MKILIIGGGGREHALAWKLAADPGGAVLFCAPGNAGTAALAENLPIQAEDLPALVQWARRERPGLVVVGPEAPLCAGAADLLQAEGFCVFGPLQAAARLEGSKVFSKDVMESAGVPTARAGRFTDARAALDYVRRQPCPLVVKADGLAAGKGVMICSTPGEAEHAVRQTMEEQVFGAAGASVLIEEFLEGEEASILALVDGKTVVPLASAQDHKRVFDGDQGPNTGGMGAYSPAPVVTEALWPAIRAQVFDRTLAELNRRGITYRGILYAGLMLGPSGIKVLEFNCRFGDPETQAILPRMHCHFASTLQACARGELREDMIRWKQDACASVVMAAGGYPGSYAKGKIIEGLADAARLENVMVFHAGTALHNGRTVTAGGRVLAATAWADTMQAAVQRAYAAVARIHFEGAQFRTDIAYRALRRT
jgi:phosphoribosylamine--glycine ligase